MHKKKKSFPFMAIGLLAIGVIGFAALNSQSIEKNKDLGLDGKSAVVYKTPSCGCCRVFADYLARFGISVSRKDLPDLSEIKKKYGVPQELESCHTTVIDDYVVEGHIPAEAIAKLLKERPAIKGIAMPGMPSGSPGMPGPKAPFTIYEIDGRENQKVFLEM